MDKKGQLQADHKCHGRVAGYKATQTQAGKLRAPPQASSLYGPTY